MEEIMKIFIINHNNEDDEIFERGLYQLFFSCRICDINLPIYNTGYMYMLISIRQIDFFTLERKMKLMK